MSIWVALEDHGDQPVTWPKEVWAFGDKKTIRVVVESLKRTALTGATATCTVYLAGSSVATPAPTVTISVQPGAWRATVETIIDASTTPFTLAGGEYIAVIQFVSGSYKRTVRIPLEVQAVP